MELQVIKEEKVLDKDFKVYGTPEEPLFLAKDVAEWIEHSDARKMIDSIDEDEKLTGTLFLSGQKREVWLLTENGFYEVLMQSRKPLAKEFKREVKQILKSIRKHGAYMTEQTLEQALTNPDFLIKLATELKNEKDKNLQLQAQNSHLVVENTIMQPKADYFDELVDRNLLTGIRETAKQLKVKQNKFVEFLLAKKYLYRDKRGKLQPYADKNDGLFELKETINEKTQWSGTQLLITPKGRETFRLLFI